MTTMTRTANDGPIQSGRDLSYWLNPALTPAGPRRGVDWRRVGRNTALAVPAVLVNVAAVFGQALYGIEHIGQAVTDATWAAVTVGVLFAVTLESIAVYLAVEAHAALMAGDAALGRRVASYAAALVVAAINWAHWAGPGYGPTVPAVSFAGLSAISPWLWGVRSKSMHRAVLRERGLIDARLPRLSAAKWVLYPVRTFRVVRWAAWENVTDPAAAVAGYDAAARARRAPERDGFIAAVRRDRERRAALRAAAGLSPEPTLILRDTLTAEEEAKAAAEVVIVTPLADANTPPRPARAAVKARTGKAAARGKGPTDEDLLPIVREYLRRTPDAGTPRVIDAVRDATGKGIGVERAARLIATAKTENGDPR